MHLCIHSFCCILCIFVILINLCNLDQDITGDHTSGSECYLYAVIREKSVGVTLDICASGQRRSNVYTTSTNSIEISIATDGTEVGYPIFLLEFQGTALMIYNWSYPTSTCSGFFWNDYERKYYIQPMTHICISILGHHWFRLGMLPVWRQAINRINVGLLIMKILGTYLSDILISIPLHQRKWIGNYLQNCDHCLGFNVLSV